MIIWSGLGFLVAVFVFGTCLITNGVVDHYLGEEYYSNHSWAIGIGLLLGGLLSALLGILLKKRGDREVIDANTGERFMLNRSNHSLFFIPMHWAGTIIAIVGSALITADVIERLLMVT